MSLLVMLAVLFLLIQRAADPNTWKFFTGEPIVAPVAETEEQPSAEQPEAKAAAGSPRGEAAGDLTAKGSALSESELAAAVEDKSQTAPGNAPADQPAPASAAPSKKAAPVAETVTAGPTDLDPEEVIGAKEQFEALSDWSLEPGPEEMPAYWRLFDWVQHQSSADMAKRAQRDPMLNDFIRRPNEVRGKLFTLDLHVRRILSYPAPANFAGVEKVYEVWGYTPESQAWLYCVLTAHLPPGMPTGAKIDERATFTGYFYKIQAYHEAGAGPKDKPKPTPVLIGRLKWKRPTAPPPKPSDGEGQWVWWVGSLIVAFGMLRVGLWAYGRLKPSPPLSDSSELVSEHKAAAVQDWLSTAGDKPPEPGSDLEFGRGKGDNSVTRRVPDVHDR